MRNLTVINNYARWVGGGIYIKHIKNITISDSLFLNNTVNPHRPLPTGGAIHADHTKDIDYFRVNFTNNTAFDHSIFHCI